MAKKVNNINYKGINHSPSLVSDNDGHASECANLSPDFNDLKPMPMPVCSDYNLEPFHTLIFVHRGVGYENYVEIDDTRTRLVLKDKEGHYLYDFESGGTHYHYWSNGSEILAVEAVGNTLVVSTKDGTVYIVYQPDVPTYGQSTGGSYKPIGQKPTMPVIEFRMHEDEEKYNEFGFISKDGESIIIQENDGIFSCTIGDEKYITEPIQGTIAKLEKRIRSDGKFYQPFFIRYAIRMHTGDYIMHSPVVLMLPSCDKCALTAEIGYTIGVGGLVIILEKTSTYVSTLQYKVNLNPDLSDWKEIISGIDVFITEPIYNYDTTTINGNELNANQTGYILSVDPIDHGKRYVDGEIRNEISTVEGNEVFYTIKGIEQNVFNKKVQSESLFHLVSSIDISDLSVNDYTDLPIDNLLNLATLPTLTDDYNSQCSISPRLMQNYNSRLNMANIRQRVFDGFANGVQPQSSGKLYPYKEQGVLIYNIIVGAPVFRVKKNGKVISVRNSIDTNVFKLDYCSYLYYPDPDCFEVVLYYAYGISSLDDRYLTLPMKRHEYLNGAYWYGDTKCLGEYIAERMDGAINAPQTTPEAERWYDIPNRFMMSAVGNPWYFPLQETFDIGLREIRALSINAENMDAPQYGQNPIYVFSTDGIWTIGINKDGTHNGISYVSGDVISEMQGLGVYPTASAPQIVFFKTARGIMAVTGSTTKEIDKVMKGRVFNPRVKLLPAGSIVEGIPTSGINSYMLDLIYNVCDDLPYADFAKDSSLMYDYRNNRLLLFNSEKRYLYVYDVANNFWSKMLPMVVDEGETSPANQQYNDRGRTPSYVVFNGMAMVGNEAVLTDDEWQLWNVGEQLDENDITTTQFGLYVSRPLRFGTDDYKTLSRVVHDYQLVAQREFAKMGLWGSRDGQNYYQITTLRGTSYKFFIVVLYTRMLPSSRYAYTAFEWEPRMTDKIR